MRVRKHGLDLPLLLPEVLGNQLGQEIRIEINAVEADFTPRKDHQFIGGSCGYKL
jgi:hypothetical protein